MIITEEMENQQENDCEKLFLLEVLVHELFISHSNLNLDHSLEENLRDTCVLFQFLHYPPLVVCESDFLGFPTGRKNTTHVTFKSGKSCFFSLRVPKGPVLPTPFEIGVSVVYKLKENMLPDKLPVGNTSIEMGESFTQLLNTNTNENCDKLPLSKSKTGTFDLKDSAGNNVGSLKAFIRISCFGKLIITQFSLNKEDEKSYFFKGTDTKQLCRDEESRNSKVDEGALFCGTGDNMRNNTGLLEVKSGKDYPTTQAKYLDRNQMKSCCYDMNGPQPQRASTVQPLTCSAPSGTQYSKYSSQRANPCECPYSRPENGMSKNMPRTQTNMGLAPGEVGLQDDQVIFQLPLKRPGDPMSSCDKENDSSIYYKLTSAEETREGQQKNTVHIKSDDLAGMGGKRIVGPVSGLPVDDGHDVFLLKIGKKCDGDKKRNLELELRTPKMKEPKPPMTDQNTQYLESDIPKDVGEKAGKGKGKEGKKGKKGKK